MAGESAVWSTFLAGTGCFGAGGGPFMVNYRVRNLEYGRFGWATDPGGNRFQLWEPR